MEKLLTAVTPPPSTAELDPDDIVEMDMPPGLEDEDGNTIAEEEEESLAKPSGCKRDFYVDIWPFAFCHEFYNLILTLTTGEESLPHVVLLSKSAHPSVMFAAMDIRAMVWVLHPGVKQHSIAHGRKLLTDNLSRI